MLGLLAPLWLRFYQRQDVRTLLLGLDDAFTFFGGVPQALHWPRSRNPIPLRPPPAQPSGGADELRPRHPAEMLDFGLMTGPALTAKGRRMRTPIVTPVPYSCTLARKLHGTGGTRLRDVSSGNRPLPKPVGTATPFPYHASSAADLVPRRQFP